MLLPPGQKERYFLFFIIYFFIRDENNGDENRSSIKLTNEKTPFFSRVFGFENEHTNRPRNDLPKLFPKTTPRRTRLC